jgi:hypothetical protein
MSGRCLCGYRVIAPQQVSAEAARLPIHQIAAFLRTHLGKRGTAYISGVSDPKMVSRWIARQNAPRDQAQMRLRRPSRQPARHRLLR